MKSPTGRAGQPSGDERLDRLLESELRAMVQAPGVNLRARVLTAIEGAPAAKRPVWEAFHPRWAVGLAAAAALVLAVYLGWPRSDAPGGLVAVATRAPLASSPLAAKTPDQVEPSAAPGRLTNAAQASRLGRQRARAGALLAGTVELSDITPTSNEPYLPGAPAGELGDPLQPMPRPPAITFAPIQSAPPISDSARPVTDFPADNPPPDAPVSSSGQTGGNRR